LLPFFLVFLSTLRLCTESPQSSTYSNYSKIVPDSEFCQSYSGSRVHETGIVSDRSQGVQKVGESCVGDSVMKLAIDCSMRVLVASIST